MRAAGIGQDVGDHCDSLVGLEISQVYVGGRQAQAVTSVPIGSPRSARVTLPAGSMPNTRMSMPLSMHRLNAVESTTFRPRCSASR